MAESLYRPLRPVGTGPGQLSVQDRMDRSLLAKFKKPARQDNEQKPVRDGDLLGSMAKRLSGLETELAASRAQVQQLQAENARLLAQQQTSSSSPPSTAPPPASSCPPPPPAAAAAAARPSALPAWQVQAGQLQQENSRLRSQCRRAWHMVEQLKAFLQDYGLVWVGDQEQEGAQQGEGQHQGGTAACMLEELQPGAASEAGGSTSQQAAGSSAAAASPAAAQSSARAPQPGAAAPARLPFDLQQLETLLQELNTQAGEGSSRLVQLHSPGSPGSSRAQPGPSASRPSGPFTLQQAPTVRLWLFSDGLQLHHCPPQPYSSPASQGIISDISDGYYPTALRQDFPEGVIIQLVDCTSQPMAAAAAAVAAAGPGAMLHAAGSSSSSSGGGGGGGPPGPLSQQQFLQKLPATVIKAGRIVSVRGDVAGFMAGQQPGSSSSAEGSGPRSTSGSPTRLVVPSADGAAAAARALPSPLASPASGLSPDGAAAGVAEPLSPAGPAEACEASVTLQVKDEQGQHTYILAMRAGHTIGELRRRIDAYRASQQEQGAAAAGGSSSSSSSYEIRSAFPARLYDDACATLQQAGLVPTATLFLRAAGSK